MRNLRHRLQKDFWGGILVGLAGVAFTAQSARYRIGTLVHMGPGYYPAVLGVIFSLLGAALAIQAYLRAPTVPTANTRPPQWRAWFLICGSIVLFIVLADRLGLAAAAFGIVFTSAFADHQNTWKSALVLALAMVVVSAVIFWWALQLQLPLFDWG